MSCAGARAASGALIGHTLPCSDAACYSCGLQCAGGASSINTAGRRTFHREIVMTDHPVARRTVIKSAGLSIGAGLASGIHSARAQAPAQAAPAEIWSHEYWAQKGDVKLSLWRKRIGAPRPGEAPLPVLFLVHGSSPSARSRYERCLPGTAA